MSEAPDEAAGLRVAMEKLCVDLEEYSDSITAVTLRALLAQHPAPHSRPVVDREALQDLMAHCASKADAGNGGFTQWQAYQDVADRLLKILDASDPVAALAPPPTEQALGS